MVFCFHQIIIWSKEFGWVILTMKLLVRGWLVFKSTWNELSRRTIKLNRRTSEQNNQRKVWAEVWCFKSQNKSKCKKNTPLFSLVIDEAWVSFFFVSLGQEHSFLEHKYPCPQKKSEFLPTKPRKSQPKNKQLEKQTFWVTDLLSFFLFV